MIFCNLTDDEYDKFASCHPQNNLNQSVHMARFQRARGLDVKLVGVKKNNEIIAASSLIFSKLHFNYKICESIKGPLMDYRDRDLVRFYTLNIKAYLKKLGVNELIISPYIIHKQRDIHGAIVDGGDDNSDIIPILSNEGYKHSGFDVNLTNVNWMVVKDVSKYASDEEMLDSFYNRTRRAAVKNAEKCGVYVEEVNSDNLGIFYDIIKNAAEAKHFHGRNLSFYSNLIKTIDAKHVKILLSCINIKDYELRISNLLKEERCKNGELAARFEENPSKNNAVKLKISENLIAKYDKSLGELDGYPTNNGVLPLAAVYFFCYGSEVVAAIGGAKDEYRQFDGATALYWHMMKFARSNGYKKFNFYGTFGIFDKKSPGHNIYLFKKGWGGEVVNTLGEFSLPIRRVNVMLYRSLKTVADMFNSLVK